MLLVSSFGSQHREQTKMNYPSSRNHGACNSMCHFITKRRRAKGSEKSITDVFLANKFTLCFTPLQMNQVDLSRLTLLALALTASWLEDHPQFSFKGDKSRFEKRSSCGRSRHFFFLQRLACLCSARTSCATLILECAFLLRFTVVCYIS